MAQTATLATAMLNAFTGKALYFTLFTTTTTNTTPGTEVTGGTYARVAATSGNAWGTPSGGSVSATPTIPNIPAGTTVIGVGYYDAATAGNYISGGPVTSQAFPTGGSYQPTCTESLA